MIGFVCESVRYGRWFDAKQCNIAKLLFRKKCPVVLYNLLFAPIVIYAREIFKNMPGSWGRTE